MTRRPLFGRDRFAAGPQAGPARRVTPPEEAGAAVADCDDEVTYYVSQPPNTFRPVLND